jgi:hypothetical protein
MKKKPAKTTVTIKKSADRPVTQKMLYGVRSELKHEITSTKLELKGDIKRLESKMESRFSQVEGRFGQMESRFGQMESRFDHMESKFEQVLSVLNHMRVDMEEQKRNNKMVLDGYVMLDQRLTRLEVKEV